MPCSSKKDIPNIWKRGGEKLPHVRGQGQHPGGATPHQRRPGGPTPLQGVVAAWAQEGLEALSHVEGQEGQR